MLKLGKGSADFLYLPETKTVFVPIMLSSSLVAYTLD
jgi:hypothetical protein